MESYTAAINPTDRSVNPANRRKWREHEQKCAVEALRVVNFRPLWHSIINDHFRPRDHEGDWEILKTFGFDDDSVFVLESPGPLRYKRPASPPAKRYSAGGSSTAEQRKSKRPRADKSTNKSSDDKSAAMSAVEADTAPGVEMGAKVAEEIGAVGLIPTGDGKKTMAIVTKFLDDMGKELGNSKCWHTMAERNQLAVFLDDVISNPTSRDIVKKSLRAKRFTHALLVEILKGEKQ